MSGLLGPVSLGDERGPGFLGLKGLESRVYSDQTALEVDREVQSMVLEAQERARGILRSNRDKLEMMAARLLSVEVIEEDEITRLWGPKATRPGTIESPGHTEAPPENPTRPVAVSDEPNWSVPNAVSHTIPEDG
jgi:cell division protease FtsH